MITPALCRNKWCFHKTTPLSTPHHHRPAVCCLISIGLFVPLSYIVPICKNAGSLGCTCPELQWSYSRCRDKVAQIPKSSDAPEGNRCLRRAERMSKIHQTQDSHLVSGTK